MRKIVSYLTIICLLSITFSCGGGGSGSAKGVSSVTILASFESFKSKSTSQKAASSTLTNIRYTVTGSGMDIMTDTVPVTSNLVEFTLEVPNGPQRHFLIEALDSSNYVRYKGEAYRDLDGTPITITIVLVSTTPNPMLGKWANAGLVHDDSGQWDSFAGTLIFNADGTGTETSKSNDGGVLTSETENFTYSITPNQDGSFTLTMVYPDEDETHNIHKIVFSDDGKMVIVDKTTDTTDQKLNVAIKMDTSKTYTNSDLSGEYYTINYEHDIPDLPHYKAWSAIEYFDGNGNVQTTSTSNGDGTLHTGTHTDSYSVNPDGSIGESGFLSGDGKLWISSAGKTDEWEFNFGMKKGDRTYTTSDLAGTWALVGFGDEDNSSSFFAQIATWTCDSNGNCAISIKRQRDGNILYEFTNRIFSVSPDGNFGASLSSLAPLYAGAIGNNGNTIILNRSFDPIELFNRRIVIGVRCSNCSNLTGQIAFERTPSLGFYGLGTQLQPTVDTLVSTPTLSDNIYNTPATTSTGTINIGQNGNKFNNIGIQLFSSEKPVDTLYIYVQNVNKNITSDTILTNPSNWKVFWSDFNLPLTWTEITIQSIVESEFDVLNNIYLYKIKFLTPQNALYFKVINMDASIINDVLITEIKTFGTDVVP